MKTGVKLFAVSSPERKPLVEAFRKELFDQAQGFNLDLEFEAWDRNTAAPGQHILDALIDQCRGADGIDESDFFATFLTEEDLRQMAEPPPALIASDNFNFEIGLFMGGLNLDFRRCFVLSSVDESALPPYLRNRTHFPFIDPPKGSKPEAYRLAVQDLAAKVWREIYEHKRCQRGILEYIRMGDLMKLERLGGQEGALDEDGEVLVNRSEPAEEKSSGFAALVSSNIRAGITYRYYFHNLDSSNTIAQLLYRIAIANPDEDGAPTNVKLERKAMIDFLSKIREKLSINLVPIPGPIEYCVHYNSGKKMAKVYMRYLDKFIDWSNVQESSLSIAKGLKALGIDDLDCDPLCVFRKTPTFDENHRDFRSTRKQLWTAISRQFADPSLEATLHQVCFGEPLK
jgi:hypothetical protein